MLNEKRKKINILWELSNALNDICKPCLLGPSASFYAMIYTFYMEDIMILLHTKSVCFAQKQFYIYSTIYLQISKLFTVCVVCAQFN